jgi:hypothetical protein
LAQPSKVRNTIEIHAPTLSSHAGACHDEADSATSAATMVTTVPWPSENRKPDQRDRRGRRSALKRVMPSIVAR